MSAVWHIFKKDARLMRAPLILWVAIQLMTFALALVVRRPAAFSGNEWQWGLGMVHTLFLAAGWQIAFLFAAMPVHDDAIASHNAFWVTRPISRLQLLGAKVLGLLLFFCLLPVLLRLPWWLGHGFGWRDTALAACDTAKLFGGLALGALALASVTNHVGQFYRWMMGILGASGLGLLLGGWLSSYSANSYFNSLTKIWSATIGLPLGCAIAGIVIYQFLAPNRVRTVLLLIGVPLLGGWLGAKFPPTSTLPRRAETWETGTWPVGANGNKPGTRNLGVVREQKSRTPGTFIAFQSANFYRAGAAVRPLYVETDRRELLQGKVLDFSTPANAEGWAAVYISPTEYARAAGADGELSVRLRGEVWTMEYMMNLPLVEGNTARQAGHFLQIDHIAPARADGTTAAETRGQLVLYETFPFLANDEKSHPEGLSEFYLLVTASGKTLIVPDIATLLRSSSVGTSTSVFPLGINRAQSSAGDQDWLKDARLVKVGFRRLGAFDEMVPLPALPSPPPSR